MKNFKKILLSTAVLASIGLAGCSNNPTESSKPEEAAACYRLTEVGAKMANDALLLKKTKKNAALHTFRKWGVYPKEVDGEEVSSEDVESSADSSESVSLEEGEGYTENDIIDTRTEDLPLSISYSMMLPNAQEALDDMFLIGNHNGVVIGKKNADEGSTESTDAILYPSTTISNEELASYDLDATWTTDSKKRIDEELFNSEQQTVVNYKLVDNSGVLSTDNKSAETNLHFTVILKNDQAPTGGAVAVEFGYDVTINELKSSLETEILSKYQSKNAAATLSVKLVNSDGTEKTVSNLSDEKAEKIAEAKVNKAFSPWNINFVVSDSDGNETGIQTAVIRLTDEVAPIIKKNGEVVDKIELGDGNGIQLCTQKVFIEGAKKLAKEKGYTFEDEIFGEVEPDFTITEDGKLTYSYVDGNENKTSDVDESLFIKNFEDANDHYYFSANIKYIDSSENRYYIKDYFTDDPTIYIMPKYMCDYYSSTDTDVDFTKGKIVNIDSYTVNEGTIFNETLVPAYIAANIGVSGVDSNIIIINAPVTINIEFVCKASADNQTSSIWINKESSITTRIDDCSIKDYYMECSETDASEKYYHNNAKNEYWYGRGINKYTFHWNVSLADFKAQFGIE